MQLCARIWVAHQQMTLWRHVGWSSSCTGEHRTATHLPHQVTLMRTTVAERPAPESGPPPRMPNLSTRSFQSHHTCDVI